MLRNVRRQTPLVLCLVVSLITVTTRLLRSRMLFMESRFTTRIVPFVPPVPLIVLASIGPVKKV